MNTLEVSTKNFLVLFVLFFYLFSSFLQLLKFFVAHEGISQFPILNKVVAFKGSFQSFAIRMGELSRTIHSSFFPLSCVKVSSFPVESTIAMEMSIFEFALILLIFIQNKKSISIFLVFMPLTLDKKQNT